MHGDRNLTDNPRKIALESLNRCFLNGSWSANTLDSLIKKYSLSPTDANFATYLVYGVIRNYRLLDFWIDPYCRKLDLCVRNILRLGTFQIRLCDKIPVSAAVNESVNLAKVAGYKSASGLINAVLRKISGDAVTYPENLAIRYSHPDWFVDRFIAEKGYSFTESLLKSNNTQAQLCYHESFSPNELYVQDNAAYQSVLMANPKEGFTVLDCCSAPGGKSFTSAMLMNNIGHIISCDIHPKKLNLVSENANRLGIKIIDTRVCDASKFDCSLKEIADVVIADVPCSGLGVIRKKPEIRFKTYDEIKTLPQIQKNIADNVKNYVKPGGYLLYSTCTILHEENEDISHSIEGFKVIEDKTYFPNVDNTDGFYSALLVRI